MSYYSVFRIDDDDQEEPIARVDWIIPGHVDFMTPEARAILAGTHPGEYPSYKTVKARWAREDVAAMRAERAAALEQEGEEEEELVED